MPNLYRVRIKRGDLEIEVESSDKEYVDEKIQEQLNTAAAKPSGRNQPGDQLSGVPNLSLQQLITKARPGKKNEVGAVIAYFLEHFAAERVVEWKPEDVAGRFTEVRKTKPKNMTDLLRKSALFMEGGQKGYYKLSEAGVEWVELRLEGHAAED